MAIEYSKNRDDRYNNDSILSELSRASQDPHAARHEIDELIESEPLSYTTYNALNTGVTEHSSYLGRDVHPAAQAHVYHYAPTPYFSARGELLNRSLFRQGKHPKLFHNIPAEVDYLEADPSMSVPAMTILGLALNDHGKLRVADSLSEYSTKIAEKGVKAGAVYPPTDNIDMEVTNAMEQRPFTRPDEDFSDGSTRLISPQEVTRARNTVRSIVRPRKRVPKPALSEQFHPQLPGLEG